MKYQLEKKEKSMILLKVEVDAGDFGKFFSKALEALGRDISAPGFRKGKVPLEKVEEVAGREKVLEKAAELAIHSTYPDIVKKENLNSLGLPRLNVTKLALGNPFSYEAEVAVWPEARLAPWREIVSSVEREDIDVSDKEIQDSLNWLQNSRAKYILANRPAVTGDRVEIDVTVSKDGKAVEGGESKNHPVILGEGKFIPGMEEKIAGMKAGEEKEFSLKMPEKYFRPELAGREVQFKVAVKSVQSVEKPELNDDFAKNIGRFDSLDKLKANIKEGILKEKETRAREARRGKILEKIAGQSEMEIPEILIEAELENSMRRFKQSIADMGLQMDQYLAQINKTEEQLKSDLRKNAAKSVRAGVVLRELAKDFEISATEEEIRQKTDEFLRHFPSFGEAEKETPPAQLRGYIEGLLKNEKVFERIERI